MDALGYTPEQLDDAATDYTLAAQAGRPHEADARAAQGRATWGVDAWLAAVERASATSWVGMLGA